MSFSSRSDSTALLSWEGLIFYYQLRGFMNNSKLKQIFENLISLVEEKKWYGACHDISAV
ncbi:acetyltransferase, partial [Salmonella enterica]|nr:acetyltransferase [Salmonella enterica]